MQGFYVYKDGDERFINQRLWMGHFQAKGWSRDKPKEEPKEPVLDFSPYDAPQLLHIAAVSNVVVAPDADRAGLEGAIRFMWSAGGKPEGWLEEALRMSAPVPAGEMKIPPVNPPGPQQIKTPDEFVAGLSEEEKAQAERVEAERVEAERVEKAEAARIVEAEKVEAERVEAERVEAERVEAERVEAERVEAEKAKETPPPEASTTEAPS